MKNILFQFLFFCITVLILPSCQKEQALVNKIEGTYKIAKIVYNTTNGDSVVMTSKSTMLFDNCILKKQSGAQQCDGYIQLEGEGRIAFGYRPETIGRNITMFLNISNPDDLMRFGGRYTTQEQTQHTLILARYSFDKFQDKVLDFQIFLEK